jgi:hypothetical protein
MRNFGSVNAAVLVTLMLSMVLLFSPMNASSSLLPLSPEYQLHDGFGYTITGTLSSEACGEYFTGVGDVSGDGIDDFIIGASANQAGRAYLFYGRPLTAWTDLLVTDAQASFVGEAFDDWFGRWIARLGDVNDDGYADFAISSMMNDDGGNEAGKVYLFFGGSDVTWTMDTPATQADVTIIGEAGDDRLGHGVYGIGDTNGDGYDDFIVSGMMNDEGGTDAGQLYLFLGRASNQWAATYSAADATASWIGTTGDGLALDASGVGDVNDDGFTDFAVGALFNVGGFVRRKVYLIFGSDTVNWVMDQPIAQSNASLVGEIDPFLSTITLSVDWISGAGDVNNDGYDDILFGAYEEDIVWTQAGQTYLFFGRPTTSWTHDMPFSTANASFIGQSTNQYCGWAVDGVGDVNGDAFADFTISVPTRMTFPSESQSAGHVYLFLGNNSGNWGMQTPVTQAAYNYTAEEEQPHSGFGFHVQGLGDINNDTLDDFAIGAPDYDNSALNKGKTYLVLPFAEPPEITPPPPPPPIELFILVGLSISIVIVVVVLLVYRRRKP